MAAAKKGITVKVKHTGKFPLPKYSTKGSAAMDLVAEIGRQQHIIQGSNQLIPTGISIEVPNGYCAKIYATEAPQVITLVSFFTAANAYSLEYMVATPLVKFAATLDESLP